MSDTITLTREQWNELFNGLDLIRDRYDAIFEVAAALTVLGLDRPAGTITAVQDEIGAAANRLQAVLIAADDEEPPLKTPDRASQRVEVEFCTCSEDGVIVNVFSDGSKTYLVPAVVIDAGKSPRGAWTRSTLARWGVPWPPPAGWRQALITGRWRTPAHDFSREA